MDNWWWWSWGCARSLSFIYYRSSCFDFISCFLSLWCLTWWYLYHFPYWFLSLFQFPIFLFVPMSFYNAFWRFWKLLPYMVNKPGLEPEPGPGLWQALNSGLAQDFKSPSPPKPGPSQGFEPEPGPIHHSMLVLSESQACVLPLPPLCEYIAITIQITIYQ